MPTTVAQGRLMATERESRLASELLHRLESGAEGLSVGGSGHEQMPLPHEIGVLLERVLQAVAAGDTLTVSTIPTVLTTSAAAALLGVSRPTLMKLIGSGELAAHKVGSHTRVNAADVFDYLRKRRDRQRAAFDELRNLLDE